MKIVILNGSPHLNGATSDMANANVLSAGRTVNR